MIKIDEETKQALAKYVGPDGKLIIDDNLPDDIKEAFEFFNQEGINILDFPENLHFAPPADEEDVFADEEDVFADGEDEPTEVDKLLESASLSTGIDVLEENASSQPVTPSVNTQAVDTEKVNQELADLDEMF